MLHHLILVGMRQDAASAYRQTLPGKLIIPALLLFALSPFASAYAADAGDSNG
ncbi:hypothetical protein UT4_18630 [Ferrigenium sp. UT4]